MRQRTVIANVSGLQLGKFVLEVLALALISRICAMSPSQRSGASGSWDLRHAWRTSVKMGEKEGL